MSTLGKVLVILIALSLLGWMFLAALVADHHIQWAKRYDVVQKEVEEAKIPPPGLRLKILEHTNAATTVQVDLERIRRNFRAELAMAQKAESETKETLSREELHHTQAEAQAVAAKKQADLRFRERQDFDKKILQEQAAADALIAENKVLKDELASLRKAFMDTVAQNKTYAARLLKKPDPAASAQPRTRLGSLVR